MARTIGFAASDQLDSKVTTRGYRQVAQINRLPGTLGERLIEHFGSLQALFAASRADLQEVEGVGEQRARAIRDGLVRVAESAYADPAPDPGADAARDERSQLMIIRSWTGLAPSSCAVAQ